MNTQQLSQENVKTVITWVEQQVPRGYVDSEQNGLAILAAIPDGTPVTLESLSAAAQSLVNQGVVLFVVKSAAQQAFDKLVAKLTQAQKETIHAWLEGQKRLIQTGDEGYLNFVAVVSFLRDRRYPITSGGLDQALSNLVNNASTKLYFVPVEEKFEGGRHSGKKFSTKKDEQSRDYVNGKLNHANNPKIVEQALGPKSQDALWEQKAEALAGHTHSQTTQAKRMFVTKHNGEVDWKATHDARAKYLDSRNGGV